MSGLFTELARCQLCRVNASRVVHLRSLNAAPAHRPLPTCFTCSFGLTAAAEALCAQLQLPDQTCADLWCDFFLLGRAASWTFHMGLQDRLVVL